MILWLAFGAMAGSGVLMTGLLLGQIVGRQNPVLRSSILVGSAALSLLLPVLASVFRSLQVRVEVPISAHMGAVSASPAFDWQTPCLILWSIGTSILLTRLLLAVSKNHRLVTRSSKLLDQRVWDASRGLRKRRARLLESGEITSPVVVGFLRPCILMPIGLVERLGRTELRAVLAHEFSHVSHGHTRIGLLMALVRSLYWPNPLIHLLSRQVFRAFEEAADSETLEQVSSREFSRVLLDLATGNHLKSPELGLSILSNGKDLEERLRLLADPARKATMKKHSLRLVGSLATLAIASVLTAAVRITKDAHVSDAWSKSPLVTVTKKKAAKESTPVGGTPIVEVVGEPVPTPEAPELKGSILEGDPVPAVVEGYRFDEQPTPPSVAEHPMPSAPQAPAAPSPVATPSEPKIAPRTSLNAVPDIRPKAAPLAPTPKAVPRVKPLAPSETPPGRVVTPEPPMTETPRPIEPSAAPDAPGTIEEVGIPLDAVPIPDEHLAPQAKDRPAVPLLENVPLLGAGPRTARKTQEKVPLLSDIPVIGHLFRPPAPKAQTKIPILSDIPIIGFILERKPESATPKKSDSPG